MGMKGMNILLLLMNDGLYYPELMIARLPVSINLPPCYMPFLQPSVLVPVMSSGCVSCNHRLS